MIRNNRLRLIKRNKTEWSHAMRLILLTVLLLAHITEYAPGATPPQRVLVLYAYEKELPAYLIVDQSLRQTLQAGATTPIELYSEYLDLNRFPLEQSLLQLIELYRVKYAARKFDVLIAVQFPALEFALKYGEELFPNVPVVYCMIEPRELELRPLPPNITGVLETLDMEGTLEAALRLQPETRNVVVVAGTSDLDRLYLNFTRQAFQPYQQDLIFTYLTDLAMEDLLQQAAHFPQKTILFYVRIQKDGLGQPFIPHDALALLARAANVPVYGMLETYLDTGMVGGHLVSFEAQGRKAAELGLRVLRGASSATLPAAESGANIYMFDWRQLRRWNILEQNLPPGSIVRDRELNIWERYQRHILWAIGLLLSQTLLIGLLLMHRAKLKRIGTALQISAEKYRILFESFPLGITISDSAGKILESNQEAERLLGMSRLELDQRQIDGAEWRIIRPDGTPMPSREYASVLALQEQRVAANVEMGIVKENGGITWISVTAAPIPLEGYGVAIAYSDISERKQAAEALAEQHWFLQRLIDSTPDHIYVKDRESRFLIANQAAIRVLGAACLDEVVGKTDFDFHTPERAKTFFQEERVIIESRQSLINHEESIVDGVTGDTKWLLTTKVPLRDQQGNITGIIGFNRDFTDRKQAEEALARSNRLLEAVIKQAPFAVHVLEGDFNHIHVIIENDESKRIMGERVEGRTDINANHPETLISKFFTVDGTEEIPLARMPGPRAVKGEHVTNEEYLFRHPDGTEIIVEASASPVYDHADQIIAIIVTFHDITARKRAEEALRTFNAELEHRVHERTAALETANKELQSFAYVVSHDLKAPLRGISHLVDWLMQDYAAAFDDKGREMAALLLNRVKRMDNLIDGLLEYSRIGRIVSQAEAIDLNLLLPDVIDSLSPLPNIQVTIAPDLPAIVGDKIRIQQVFANLIGNAVKFIDKPQGAIIVRCDDAGDDWQFSVSDNGRGIAPQHYERIFQIFQTLKSRDDQESTGIGLSVVKKIVEFYGGKIWVESQVGKGSTFLFTFPKQRGQL